MNNDIIKKIISRKKSGIDCTEQESAEIKGFLKGLFTSARKGRLYYFDKVAMIADIEKFLPLEYGDVLYEMKQK